MNSVRGAEGRLTAAARPDRLSLALGFTVALPWPSVLSSSLLAHSLALCISLTLSTSPLRRSLSHNPRSLVRSDTTKRCTLQRQSFPIVINSTSLSIVLNPLYCHFLHALTKPPNFSPIQVLLLVFHINSARMPLAH